MMDMSGANTKMSANQDEYKFDREQWLHNLILRKMQYLKYLPIVRHKPLTEIKPQQWAKTLLLDPTYQLR